MPTPVVHAQVTVTHGYMETVVAASRDIAVPGGERLDRDNADAVLRIVQETLSTLLGEARLAVRTYTSQLPSSEPTAASGQTVHIQPAVDISLTPDPQE
jgi:hypothetical protein